MPSLLSLPNELIIKIADRVETCKSFRGTCRRIDLIVSPQVLSRLVIDINKRSIDQSISQLEALASKSIRAAEFVRTVDIRHLAPNHDPDPSWRNFWGFKPNLTMNNRDPDWALAIVCEFLATLPKLRMLYLTGSAGSEGHRPGVRLNWHISSVTKLTLREFDDSISEIIGSSPGLTHLDLEYARAFGERTPTFHDLISKVPADCPLQLHHLRIQGCCIRLDHQTLPHLRQLRSLVLCDVPWIRDDKRLLHPPRVLAKSDKFASSLSDVWGVVRRVALPIEEAITPVDDAVLDHLAALNGLRKLVITQAISRTNSSTTWTRLSAPSDAENEVLARKFFACVLPRHCKTLVSLNVLSMCGGPWFLGSNAESLLECTQLTELSIPEEVLRIAARFPNLHRLRFSAGHAWYKRRGSMSARRHISAEELVTSIKSYGPVDPGIHPPLLEYGNKGFQPRRGSDGVIRYMPEYLYLSIN
ncbi:hypothetical protein BD779DRAFT_1530897 [Infundibulicybe gibba]|nr:hypothetical protein BD779DRAFT_1530897 [Infundibulicybe gibba]